MDTDRGLWNLCNKHHVLPPSLRSKILLKLPKPPCVSSYDHLYHDFDHQDSRALETTNGSRGGDKHLEVSEADLWVGSHTPCLPPYPPYLFKSVSHNKLPAWARERELHHHGRNGHYSFVQTGDLGHLEAVGSYWGLVGGEAVESCGRHAGVPWRGQGAVRTAVATSPGDGRHKAILGFPQLGKEAAAWGSSWGPGWALRLEPSAPSNH